MNTGASRAATGSITANVDSTLTLAEPSNCVLISNNSGATFYIAINQTASPTSYDFILGDQGRAWITDIVVQTIHVYGNATDNLRVIHW